MKKFFALVAFASAFAFANAQEEIGGILYDDGINDKWEFKFDFGGKISANGDDDRGQTGKEESLAIDLGVGYNFTSNWYAGLSSGYFWKFGREVNQVIPALADVVYRWNLGDSEKWSIFLEGRGGYLFSIKGDKTLKDGTDYDYKGYTYFDVQPGIYYRVRRNIDLKFALGYGYAIAGDDEVNHKSHNTNEHLFAATIGMNFRGKPKSATRSELYAEAARLADEAERARLAALEAERKAQELAAQQAAEAEAARLAAEKAAAEAAAAAAAAKAKVMDLVFFFEIRETEISPEEDAKLRELAQFVQDNKVEMIYIKGYADRGTGNPYVNRRYAKQRAENLENTLIKKYGIDKKYIECMSYGDTVQPYAENDKNRCATIFVEFE